MNVEVLGYMFTGFAGAELHALHGLKLRGLMLQSQKAI